MNVSKLISSFALTFFVAFAGSLVTTPSISSWYALLNKPSFNPPNWIFAPVWTILFALMGVSFYLVWKKGLKHKKVGLALGIFLVQLFFNFLWSLVFFNLHLPESAFSVIVLLWLFISLTIISFKDISKRAALLLIPYLLWVSFASYLNWAIVQLNK